MAQARNFVRNWSSDNKRNTNYDESQQTIVLICLINKFILLAVGKSKLHNFVK